MTTREIALQEFNEVKNTLGCSEILAWHIWKRAFDRAAISLPSVKEVILEEIKRLKEEACKIAIQKKKDYKKNRELIIRIDYGQNSVIEFLTELENFIEGKTNG